MENPENPLNPTDFLDMDLYKIVSKLVSKPESSSTWEDVVLRMYYDLRVDEPEQAELLDGLVRNPGNVRKIDPLILGKVLVGYVDDVLEDWTSESTTKTSNLMIQSLPLFVEMSKSIPHVNPGDKYKTAFRGTDFSDRKLKAFVEKTKPSDWTPTKLYGGNCMVYTGPLKRAFIYKPHRPVQSWSVSDKAAAGFGSNVISVPLDYSFFFDPKFTGIFGYNHEKETIHFGNKPMKVILSVSKLEYMQIRRLSSKSVDENSLTETTEISDEDGTLVLPI